jgi:23S rRNA (pseudouridine1915-N3)-methyltransferase
LIDQTLIHNPNIVFIIGSSEGLANEVKQRANYRLSFSQLTFPHQLFRLILLEQIYRSYKITNNERYHK